MRNRESPSRRIPGGAVGHCPLLQRELNLREFARRALLALEVDGLNAELVLVDVGSKDGTARVIRELMQEHPGRVVGLFHTRNRGHCRRLAHWG